MKLTQNLKLKMQNDNVKLKTENLFKKRMVLNFELWFLALHF